MKKRILVLSLLLTVLVVLFFSQRSSKKERFWRKKAQNYLKNPLSLRDEFELFQERIRDTKSRTRCYESVSHSSDLVDSLRWQLVQTQAQLQIDSIIFTKIIDSLSNRIKSLEAE